MIGIDFIADTNVLIAIKEGRENVRDIIHHNFAVSIITEIELIGWKDISKIDKSIFKGMLKKCPIIPLTEEIKDCCIKIKQQYKIKTPDAIIAATSIICGVPLITGDKLLGKVKQLDMLLI